METSKAEENRLRRWANRLGLKLVKSRARNWHVHNQQGYMLIDPSYNAVVRGGDFEYDLQDVADALDEMEQNQRMSAAEDAEGRG